MTNDHHGYRLQRNLKEDFAKNCPTLDSNPENLLFLQGYEGEMFRELITEEIDSEKDVNNILNPFRPERRTKREKS